MICTCDRKAITASSAFGLTVNTTTLRTQNEDDDAYVRLELLVPDLLRLTKDGSARTAPPGAQAPARYLLSTPASARTSLSAWGAQLPLLVTRHPRSPTLWVAALGLYAHLDRQGCFAP